MAHKLVQMGLRGITFTIMVLAFFFNSEYHDLTTTDHFFMTGVYGSYLIITFGLLLEAGLHYNSAKYVEALLLSLGILLNLICAILSFVEYYSETIHQDQRISKSFLSIFSLMVYLADLTVLFCYD